MKYIDLSKCLLALAILFSISNLSAQSKSERLAKKAAELQAADTKITKVHISEERETPYMITFDLADEAAYQFSDAQTLIEQKLGLRKNVDEIKFHKSIPLPKLGLETQRFEQYYQGVKVEHGDYVATGKGEKLVAINGEYYELDGININPSLNEEDALQQAINWVGAESYAHDHIMEAYSGVYAPDVMSPWYNAYQEYYPTGELVIVDDYNTKALDHNLAWKFNIYALSPRSRGEIYVNAHTGKIMLNDPIIKHFQASGTPGSAVVATRYSGMKTIQTTELDGDGGYNEPNPLNDMARALTDSRSTNAGVLTNLPYTETDVWVLIDQTKQTAPFNTSGTARVETYDVNAVGGAPISLPIYGQANSFTDNDNNWTPVEHVRSLSNAVAERQHDDDIAFDAHWGAGVVYDYWRDQHQRDSYDGEGAPIRSYVHIGAAFDNAFWNGSVMSYGDGMNFKSLTSLDVCGHEVGHAVCSNTSDLVYARQSGGMNEGFSDIWAATTEYYQILKEPGLAYEPITNPAGYRPFGIGEQIDTDGDDATTDRSEGALRWMDAPLTKGDPDTFGGDRWTETESCEPSLANDQCGVHSNSGVLNKWFYLMTIGSGAGSGPDRKYVGTGANADDEMRDANASDPDPNAGNNSIAYSVEKGLGFIIAEQIAFGAEVLLTANGTFAECRLASVVVAQAMGTQVISNPDNSAEVFTYTGGACGDIVENVVNAWHGVGVGEPFDCNGLDLLTAGFLGIDQAVVESAAANDCDAFSTIEIDYFLNGTTAAQTIEVDAASTATEGKDFIIDTKTFTNASTTYSANKFTIKIINDAIVEGTETIVLKFPVGSNSDFDTRTITLNDDDVTPTIGDGNATSLMSEDFSNTDDFVNGLPENWDIIEAVPGPNKWYVAGPPNASTTLAGNLLSGMAYVGLEQSDASDTYNGNGNADITLVTGLIDARGFKDVKVKFDWGAGGERDAGVNADEFDFGQLTYSFNGTDFFQVPDANFVGIGSASPLAVASGTYDEAFSPLDGQQFYIGFRWFNDPLVGNGSSFGVDNIEVSGVPAKIESQVGEGKVARIDAATETYFLSAQDGDVVARFNDAASDIGCANVTVTAAGTSTATLGTGLRSGKVFQVSEMAGSPAHKMTLYFTLAELNGLSGFMDLKIAKASADYSTDVPAGLQTDDNTIATAITAPGTSDIIAYEYRTETLLGNGFYTITNELQQDALAVELTNLTATPKAATIQLDWATANEFDNKGFQVERQITGENAWSNIGFVNGQGNTTTGHTYQFVDRNVNSNVTYLYRLVQLDLNNAKTISNIVSAMVEGQSTAVSITPNPAIDHVVVSINATDATSATVSLLSISGQVLNVNTNANTTGATRVDLSTYPSGIYFIRVETAQGATVEKVVKR